MNSDPRHTSSAIWNTAALALLSTLAFVPTALGQDFSKLADASAVLPDGYTSVFEFHSGRGEIYVYGTQKPAFGLYQGKVVSLRLLLPQIDLIGGRLDFPQFWPEGLSAVHHAALQFAPEGAGPIDEPFMSWTSFSHQKQSWPR
jgi:hypothetical protein